MSETTKFELEGNLEEVTPGELLQILGLVQKTGSLHLKSGRLEGQIIFKNGLAVFAHVPTATQQALTVIHRDSQEELRHLVQEAIETLLRLEEGSFHFQEQPIHQTQVTFNDATPFCLDEGLKSDDLGFVEHSGRGKARATTSKRRSSGDGPPGSDAVDDQTPETPLNTARPNAPEPVRAEMATEESTPHQDTDESSERRVLLVDDEPAVRDVLAAALRIFGFETHIVSTFEQALNRAREFDLERRNFSLVTALQMPIVSTMSPRAGFELVANLHQSGIRPLTVLVAEQLNPQAQEEAKKLGIEVAIKPVFSKLDSSAYLKDLRAFVVTVRQLLSGEDTEIDQSMDANEDRLLPYFLSSITEQIADPNQSVDASRMVLPVAASIDLHERKRTSGSHDLDPSSDSGTGLRRAPRISGLTIEADIRTADRTIRVEVTDLAEGGAFLVTDQRFAVGEMLRVRVFLPGQLGRIEMEAKVAWIKECSSGQQPGVGIEFVGILPNSHSVGLVAAGELPSQ